MKILHLLDIPWWSGLSSYAFDCAEAQMALGHSVEIGCAEGTLPHRKAEERNWKVFMIGDRGTLGGLYTFLLLGTRFLAERPDWIIAHTGSTHWIAWFWGNLLGIKTVRTRATSQKLKSSAANRKIYSGTRTIVAGSDPLSRECARILSDPSKIKTLYPPVTLQNAVAQETNLILGMAARLDPVKGHSDLLAAFQKVREAFPAAELHLAGPEENIRWKDLLVRIHELDLGGVTYHGFLSSDQLKDFMARCSLGLLCSTDSEEISRVLMEWMSFGKPVVATSVGSIPEILKDGAGGYLVPARQPERMAEKIGELLAKPELRAQMGEFNRKTCRERFSPENFRAQWDEILKS